MNPHQKVAHYPKAGGPETTGKVFCFKVHIDEYGYVYFSMEENNMKNAASLLLVKE